MNRLASVLVLALCGVAAAQDPSALVKRILLPGESVQAARRLEEIDRLVRPELTADALVQVLGAGAGPSGPFGAWTATVAQQISEQKWPQAMEEYQRLLHEAGDALVPVLDGGRDSF